MIKFLKTLPLLLLIFLLISCGAEKNVYTDKQFFAMDTLIALRLDVPEESAESAVSADEAAAECERITLEIENILSRTKPESDLSALNGAIDVMLSPNPVLLSVLETAVRLSELTGGAYDPTVGTLTETWNILGDDFTPPEAEKIREALSHVGTDKLTITENGIEKQDPDCIVDLGGAGKGYAAQEIVTYLSGTGIRGGLVSLGGNVGVFGEKADGSPYKIGIRDPDDAASVVGYLYISNGFVAVSGDYERYAEYGGIRYHHIFDPKTGYPVMNGVRSVAVYSVNGTTADILSTALFVMGVDDAMELYREGSLTFEAVFLTNDGKIVLTPGLTEEKFELASDKYVLDGTETAEG